jgi:hypothetical protein
MDVLWYYFLWISGASASAKTRFVDQQITAPIFGTKQRFQPKANDQHGVFG